MDVSDYIRAHQRWGMSSLQTQNPAEIDKIPNNQLYQQSEVYELGYY